VRTVIAQGRVKKGTLLEEPEGRGDRHRRRAGVRSARCITCETVTGVSGHVLRGAIFLAPRHPVNYRRGGASVIAAQSIGEPGTQLPCGNVHIGRRATRFPRSRSSRSNFDGKKIKIKKKELMKNSDGEMIAMAPNMVGGRDRSRRDRAGGAPDP